MKPPAHLPCLVVTQSLQPPGGNSPVTTGKEGYAHHSDAIPDVTSPQKPAYSSSPCVIRYFIFYFILLVVVLDTLGLQCCDVTAHLLSFR